MAVTVPTWAEKRYGMVGGRATATIAVGTIGRQAEDPEGGEGWIVVLLPWQDAMRGRFSEVDLEGSTATGGLVMVKVAFSRIGLKAKHGLRKAPRTGWGGRYIDFPEGVRFSTLSVRRAYGGAGQASLLSESSVEHEMSDEGEGEEIQRRKQPAGAAAVEEVLSPESPGRPSLYSQAVATRSVTERMSPGPGRAAVVMKRESPDGRTKAVVVRAVRSPGVWNLGSEYRWLWVRRGPS